MRPCARMSRSLATLLLVALAACGAPHGAAHPLPVAAATSSAPVTASAHAAALAPILGAVRADRMKSDVARLAAFGTRHTLSDATSKERGIGAARAWIAGELARSGASTSLDRHVVAADGKRIASDTEIVNVVGIAPGAMPAAAARRYVVVGHYDSRATDVMDAARDAPGAN